MSNFRIGQTVKVKCEIQPGAFSGERLVKIETGQGVITGFVKTHQITVESKSYGYVLGRIVDLKPRAVLVSLPGSFFTTAAGLASLAPDWAATNLRSATS